MALFRDHPGEPVPEENFWTLWCKGRLTEADTLTIRLGATPSRLSSAHLHHIFLQARCPSCRPTNSIKALKAIQTTECVKHLIKLYACIVCAVAILFGMLVGQVKMAELVSQLVYYLVVSYICFYAPKEEERASCYRQMQ